MKNVVSFKTVVFFAFALAFGALMADCCAPAPAEKTPAAPKAAASCVEKAQAAIVQDEATKDWFVTATADILNPGTAPAWRSLRLSVVDAEGSVVQTFKHDDVAHERTCYDCHGSEVAAGARKAASLKVRLIEKKEGYKARLTLADSEKKVLETVLVPLTDKK